VRIFAGRATADFSLRGSYRESAFGAVGDEQRFEEGARRFLATQGDLLNARDHAYRFWRFLSKTRVSRAAVGFVPQRAATRLVWKTEPHLYRTNFKHKSRLPVESI